MGCGAGYGTMGHLRWIGVQMATSPNYGWTEPDNTSYVKDGALAIRTLGNEIDATVYAQSLVIKDLIHPFLLMGA